MNRTRALFFLILGLTAIVVIGAVVINAITGQNLNPNVPATATPVGPVAATPAAVQTAELKSPNAIFGAGYTPGDGKPTYICGTDAFASYLTLVQIQTGGYDVKHGFHLGIIPFQLNNDYALSEDQTDALVDGGQWDCVLNTADSVASGSHGIITAIVDESAGGDGMWARDITTLNDLKGKRITFVRSSSAEYFVNYVLSVARLNPRFDVTLVPAETPDEAVQVFNEGKADVVSAWEPQLSQAKNGGGKPLITSAQLRIIVDVIITSRKAIAERPDVVQAFHDAWFDALKAQTDNFDQAAQQIGDWGNNDWTAVSKANAAKDFRAQLEQIAQADLGANAFVMRDPTLLVNRLNISRRVWAASGATVPNDTIEDLVNPSFVAKSASQAALQPSGKPINQTFSMSGKQEIADVGGLKTEDAATLAVLPCRRFTFLPESTTLTLESRRILDDCVVPTMQQSVGLFLKVRGSSAWPGPKGTYTEAQIAEFAKARAQAVVDYLVTQNVDPARFVVDFTLPPDERRETEDADLQAEDRFVEMTLITVGR